MKKKLIAIVITALLTGGIGGSVVYNKSHDKTTETEVAQVIQEESTSDDSNLDREAEVIESSTDNSNEVVETVVEKDNNDIKEDKQDHNVVQVSQQSSETNKVSVKQNNSSSQPVKNISSNVNNTANSSNVNNTVNSSENFMAQVEQLIYSKVNEQRAANGLSQLSYNDTMQKYARIKSKDMGDNNYFDHKDLNGNLITVKMKNDGVSYNAWAENIAYISGVSDANALANQFMTNWMNSEGHRKNILSTNVNSIGIGVYKIGNKVYATQEFYR